MTFRIIAGSNGVTKMVEPVALGWKKVKEEVTLPCVGLEKRDIMSLNHGLEW